MDITTAWHDPIIVAIPFFAFFIGLEMLSFAVVRDESPIRAYNAKDSAVSVTMGAVSLVINVIARGAMLIIYAELYAYAPFKWDTQNVTTWVAAFFVVDLVWYGYHRMSHRVRLFWAAHQVHHNSQYLNYFTALRQKWNPVLELVLWIPLPLLGIPAWVIFSAFSFNLIYQFFLHTERINRLPGWIEFVFNTPSHHRVHHGSDPDYIDKNYAGVLILWDRLFGTFQPETHPAKYGLVTNVDSYNVLTLQFHEYLSILRYVRGPARPLSKLRYVLGPPFEHSQPSSCTALLSDRSSGIQFRSPGK
jgi:sterol desaturase/sphingolipid hydroxylase (fatty acid hydroxylase superfamily)